MTRLAGSTLPRPHYRQRHPVRRFLSAMVPPQVLDFWTLRLDPTWSSRQALARIVGREDASSDAVTLWLQPNRHWRGFRAGQHLGVGVEIEGRLVTRSYSLCEAPRADGRLAITVKRVAGGKLSPHLCDVARIGDVLQLAPAFGAMTWPAAPQGAWLFLAAGSGITPLMGLIRAAAANAMPNPLTLLYWTRTRAEQCFADELRALAAAHPNFRVHFVLTREPELRADELGGRLDTSVLQARVPDLDQRQVFACGPGGFVDSARALLADRVGHFEAEAFSPPPRGVEESGEVQVTLARRGRRVSIARGESLLTALEAQGIALASGCRMGICNTCACAKTSGEARHLYTDAVVDEPVSALKLCVHRAASDLVLDL